MLEPEDWVAIAFLIFIGGLVYLGVHSKITGALDQRQARIKGELDEARRLRDEAQALLADYRNKQHEAEQCEAIAVAHDRRLGADRSVSF